MKKKLDWQAFLFAYIDENKFAPFEWGKWDCCKFSDGCIKAMTGKSLIPKELKWKNEESAMAAIKGAISCCGASIHARTRAISSTTCPRRFWGASFFPWGN